MNDYDDDDCCSSSCLWEVNWEVYHERCFYWRFMCWLQMIDMMQSLTGYDSQKIDTINYIQLW